MNYPKESLLKMTKMPFISSYIALFVLKMFKFLWKNGLNRKKVNSKIYDITTWLTNNYSTHIVQYLMK